jgi:hypothetical protein
MVQVISDVSLVAKPSNSPVLSLHRVMRTSSGGEGGNALLSALGSYYSQATLIHNSLSLSVLSCSLHPFLSTIKGVCTLSLPSLRRRSFSGSALSYRRHWDVCVECDSRVVRFSGSLSRYGACEQLKGLSCLSITFMTSCLHFAPLGVDNWPSGFSKEPP